MSVKIRFAGNIVAEQHEFSVPAHGVGNTLSGAGVFLCVVIVMIAVLGSLSVHADEVLTDENLDAAIGRIERIARQLDPAGSEPPAANAYFTLGQEADALAELLSREVAAHGGVERALLDLALEHAADHGVTIEWSEDHARYFYDGAAFRRYLELAPAGKNAAGSEFWIVQDDFYHSNASDQDSLLRSSAGKQDFLERFADFAEAPKVSLWLGIDFRDLWRVCRASGDSDCADRYRELARARFQELAVVHAGSDIGEIAERMRRRFEAEIAAGTEESQPAP